jgi:5-hydroxyisourate hydrolase-like protein (transthyretin family)/protocatechuate 3,4-dioxygenase beta subunit
VDASAVMAMLLGTVVLVSLLAATPVATPELEITGRVIDAQGKPAAKVPVTVAAAGPSAEPLSETATDGEGRFRLVASSIGMYEVDVHAPGMLPMRASLYPLLQSTDLPPLRLEPGDPLRIRVLGQGGRPQTQARATIWPNLPTKSANGWSTAPRSAPAGEDGTIVLPRRRGESVDVAAIAPGSAEVRAARVSAAMADLRTAAACARIVRVRTSQGAPAANVAIATDRFPLGSTDANGEVTIAAPCAQPFVFTAQAADGGSARGTLQPVANEPAPPYELTLEAAPRYSGRVVDAETRAPLAGALVWLDGDPAGFARTDAKGNYVVTRAASSADAPMQFRAAASGHLSGLEKIPARRMAAPTFALAPTSALAGFVVDGDGRAVTEAEVHVDEWSSESLLTFRPRVEGLSARTVSRANGAFRIEVLPHRAYTLRASRTGFAPASLTIAEKIAPATVRANLRLILSAGDSAFGKIVNADATPIVAGRIRLTQATARANLPRYLRMLDERPELELETDSDGEGNFRFEHLPAGRFDLLVRADGYAPHTQRGITIEGGQRPTDLGAVTLERGSGLEGVVVDDDDRPVEGATVAARPPSAAGIRADALDALTDPKDVHEATTGRDGRFSLSGLTTGESVDVTARRQGYVPATLARVEVPSSEPLRFALEPAARVTGRVLSDDGAPVAAATVTARPADAALPAALSGRTAMTDTEGSFVLDDLAAGKLSLAAVAKDYLASEARVLDIAEGRGVDDVELTLHRGATVEGTVLTYEGKPATSARVVLRRNNNPERMLEIEVAGSVRTDGDGRYYLEGVPLGPQNVSADQEGYQRTVRDVDVQRGPNRLDFRLGQGYGITGRVIDGSGRPLVGVAVALLSAAPGVAKEDVSGSDGAFRFAGLAMGGYQLSGRKEGYSTARQDVQLADRAVDGVELRLEQGGGVIAGRILGLRLQSLPQLRIDAIKRPLDSLDAMREGHADAQGGYRIEGVYAGEWSVTARLPDGRQVRKSASIADASRETQLDLEFGAGVTLSGKVRRQGQAVPDVSVQATGRGTESFGSAVTDAGGAFWIEGLESGEYEVVATVTQSGLRAERVVTLQGSQTLDIDLPTARATGLVVDSAGAPLAGVSVAADGASPSAFAPRTTTDADGSFVLTNLGRGSYRISGSKDGYVRGELRIELPSEDASADNLRLILDREPMR